MEFLAALAIAWLIQKAWDQSGASSGSTSAPARAARAVASRAQRSSRRRSEGQVTTGSGGPPGSNVVATGAGWIRQSVPDVARRWWGRRAENWRNGWAEGRGLAQGRLPGEPPLSPAGGDGSATGTDPTNPTTSTPGPTGPGIAPPEGDTMTAPAPAVGAPSTPFGPSGSAGRGGGVAAAEFTLTDLLALAERWSKEADYAAGEMEAGKMGTETVTGLRSFQESALAFLGLMNRLHGTVRQAVNDAPVVGQTDRYVDR